MPLRNVQVDVDDAIFQAALNRATRENKVIGQVIGAYLAQYAQGAAAGAPTAYTVQSGDTLGRIAQKFYGDARRYPLIQQANNLANASSIWVGQVLVIPPLNTGAAATASASSSPTPPSPTPPPRPVATVPTTSPIATTPVVTTQPTRTGAPPPQPPIQWVGSPNFNQRRSPSDITAIVIHSTANDRLQGVIDWFNNPNAQVSAHYTIGKDGKIVQHVRDTERAWHAGQSVWKGRNSVNDYAVGIELVNLNNGQDPYPEAQHQANVALCAHLCYTHNIKVDDIMGHLDIALPPGRKTDPRGYDLNRLRREAAAALGESWP
ncbi:MAG: N-acetylmuramoyl-L-alanine amidase [Chloroflexi bacterium]|nr:N-acetylmuramoyl-L-alanine amidase [Chloroflexota bacterium]